MAKSRDTTPKRVQVRSGAPLNLNIDQELRDALNRLVNDDEGDDGRTTTIRSAVEGALRQYLSTKGYWPPKVKPQ